MCFVQGVDSSTFNKNFNGLLKLKLVSCELASNVADSGVAVHSDGKVKPSVPWQ